MARRAQTTMVVAATAFVGTAVIARRRVVSPREARCFRRLNRAPDRWFPVVWIVMQAGSIGAVPAAAAAVGRRSGRRHGRVVLITGSATWLAVKLIKPLIRRGRPADHLDDVVVRGQAQSGLGYPSGHAAVATALALAASRRPATLGFGRAAALLVGSSRVYVGAHLPLDVAGGLAIGTLAGTIARTEL